MKINHKLLAGLLGVPVIFAAVALFLIVANKQVQRDTRDMTTYNMKLEMGAANLSVALLTGEKAAEELMAEKRRARQEPKERNAAEESARAAEQTIRSSETSIHEILDSLSETTQGAFDAARQRGDGAALPHTAT
jgi:hypothetical protein